MYLESLINLLHLFYRNVYCVFLYGPYRSARNLIWSYLIWPHCGTASTSYKYNTLTTYVPFRSAKSWNMIDITVDVFYFKYKFLIFNNVGMVISYIFYSSLLVQIQMLTFVIVKGTMVKDIWIILHLFLVAKGSAPNMLL